MVTRRDFLKTMSMASAGWFFVKFGGTSSIVNK